MMTLCDQRAMARRQVMLQSREFLVMYFSSTDAGPTLRQSHAFSLPEGDARTITRMGHIVEA